MEEKGQQGTVENVITDRVYNLRTCMPKHQHACCMHVSPTTTEFAWLKQASLWCGNDSGLAV